MTLIIIIIINTVAVANMSTACDKVHVGIAALVTKEVDGRVHVLVGRRIASHGAGSLQLPGEWNSGDRERGTEWVYKDSLLNYNKVAILNLVRAGVSAQCERHARRQDTSFNLTSPSLST